MCLRGFLGVLRLLIFVACAPFCYGRGPEWTRVTTPNFELFTTVSEKRGKEIIDIFEQVRDFFLRHRGVQTASEFPVRIIAFEKEKEFAAFRPGESAAAFYIGDEARDYIVMGSLTQQQFHVAVHEYMHLLVKHSGLKFPVWLNEGFAEVHATLEPVGGKLRIGAGIPGRVYSLIQNKWMPLDALFQVTHESPEYNEKNRTGILYAQSWLLTHMLILSRPYGSKFPEFATEMQRSSAEESFQKVYGKTLPELDKELRAYYSAGRVPVAIFDAKLAKPAEAPAISSAPPLEVELALADLHSLCRNKKDADAGFQKLASNHPNDARIAEAMGAHAWRNHDTPQAIEHYGLAARLGSQNGRMYWNYARLLDSLPERRKEAVAAYQRTVELQPLNLEARLYFGYSLYHEKRYGQAAAELAQLKRVTPDQAPRYFATLAWCHFRMNNFAEARKNTELAKKFAKTGDSVESLDSLLAHMDYQDKLKEFEAKQKELAARIQTQTAPSAPEAPAEDAPEIPVPQPAGPRPESLFAMAGLFRELDCREKTAIIKLEVGSRNHRFLIEDPSNIQLRNAGGDFVNFTCGVQKGERVVVRYKRPEPPITGLAGIVRGIEFFK